MTTGSSMSCSSSPSSSQRDLPRSLPRLGAERLGDPTARRAGRITLNPIRHIDPVGSLLFPAVLAAAGQSVWDGHARCRSSPVASGTRPADGLVALAGPATNLALAAVAGGLGPFVDLRSAGRRRPSGRRLLAGAGDRRHDWALWARVLFAFLLVNCALAIFNMLRFRPRRQPARPLVLPPKGREAFDRLAPYGFLVIFLLVVSSPERWVSSGRPSAA